MLYISPRKMEIPTIITEALSGQGNQFLGAGLIMGGITAAFLTLKKFFIWAWERIERRFVYQVYMDNSTYMYRAFSEWYGATYPHKFTNVELRADRRNNKVYDILVAERRQYKDWNTLWYRRRLIHIVKQRDVLEQAKDQESRDMNMYYVFGLWAKKAINQMMEEALEFYNTQELSKEGVRAVTLCPWGPDEDSVTYLTGIKSLKHIYSKGKDTIVADIQHFLNSREFYNTKGIKYKRNYLLSGIGGTGKSTLIVAIAEWLKRPIYYIRPSVISDETFDKTVFKITRNSIVVIEDIDIFFTNREDSKNKSEISFQTILNFLDGALSPSDVLIFMTTNHPEKLDSALIRKGRVDLHVEMGPPSAEEVSGYMSDFYGEPVQVEQDSTIPMSAIQDICLTNPIEKAKQLV